MGDDLDSYIINAESSGNPSAQNQHSSAGGLGQFIDTTWLSMVKQYAPSVVQGMNDNQILALKTNPQYADLNRQMVDAYARQNAAALHAAGFEPTPGNIYLAHFLGSDGATSVLRANPQTPVSQIVPRAIGPNPFMKDMTASQLQNWAASKVNGAAPANTAPANTSGMPAAPASFLSNLPVLGGLAGGSGAGASFGALGGGAGANAGLSALAAQQLTPAQITPNPPDVLNNSALASRLYAAMKPNIVSNMGGGLNLNQTIAQRLRGIIAGSNQFDPNAQQPQQQQT